MTKQVEVPGVGFVVAGSQEDAVAMQLKIQARHEFSLGYMAKMGWGDVPGRLTIEQIVEIRSQPEWKTAR